MDLYGVSELVPPLMPPGFSAFSKVVPRGHSDVVPKQLKSSHLPRSGGRPESRIAPIRPRWTERQTATVLSALPSRAVAATPQAGLSGGGCATFGAAMAGLIGTGHSRVGR